MHKDPICGMDVKEDTSFKVQKDGQVHYFCSAHCKDKFVKNSSVKLHVVASSSAKVIYTCPMHPEIQQDHPGDCPKCGMHLEPVNQIGDSPHLNTFIQVATCSTSAPVRHIELK